ncbi:hypothetical protein GUITHDRAFT_110228 [Guillardia theta CCMP2712]|uniref:Uncharacterized protein n=1 Tax=Guillardia theta (strain CCMP2712) TaxID=905079 RepID=L1J5H5_GUITC|nr:hypothetical protein GUITHDRAFT_110228 [Guillardia theta CCMP2712]EKX43773.1 hypothetical protein GUITHDRAFT_110228 [Guillardia theta CCMP2712]|eukprot:XP_005830753.1 hypothetical protein GUITHDRAFT_110228 [Guillardia theta CCMP2712]
MKQISHETEDILARCKAMNEQQLYASSAAITSFLISEDARSTEVYMVNAEALHGLGEYLRAAEVYKQAHECLSEAEQKGEEGAKVLQAMAECYGKGDQQRKQLATLLSIPEELRTVRVHVEIAKLQHRAGAADKALSALKSALDDAPLAIEMIEELVWAGQSEEEIMSHFRCMVEKGWLLDFIRARVQHAMYDYKGALHSYKQVAEAFPENLEVMSGMATCQLHTRDVVGATKAFERVHEKDRHYLDRMEEYGSALKATGSSAKLNIVGYELVNVSPQRPEGWIVCSMYMECQEEKELALEYAERAIQVAPRSSAALIQRGRIQLDAEKYDLALMSFREALGIAKSIHAYQGLVRGYIGARRVKEAITTARESLQQMPKNAQAFKLVGLALAQLPEGVSKAKTAFERAIQLDPTCPESVLELVDILEEENKLQESVEVMERFVSKTESDVAHCRLGDLYLKLGRFQNALVSYHNALSAHPGMEAATIGLSRLEKAMKGIDPDGDGEMQQDNDDIDGFGSTNLSD